MTERKEYKCDSRSIGCPRVQLQAKLAGNGELLARLMQQPYIQTARDQARTQATVDNQGAGEVPGQVIPLTCDYLFACTEVAKGIEQQLAPRLPGMPGTGLPNIPPGGR